MNYEGIAKWVSLALFLILLVGLIQYVSANDANTTYPLTPWYRLPAQGADVYVNDTVDISGQGWGEGVAWYGRWGEFTEPVYVRLFANNFNKKDLRNFYFDPAIFAERTGTWYQYYGNKSEKNGNLVAFKVVSHYKNSTERLANGTIVNRSIAISNVTIDRIIPEVIVPEMPVASYLVAIGDEINTGVSKGWLFGRTDYLYAVDGFLTKSDVESLSPGSYKLYDQKPGCNTIYDVGYNPVKNDIWRIEYDSKSGASTELVSVSGVQPRVATDLFKSAITVTDDTIDEYTLEVQEPAITIISIDEVAVGNRIPIAYEPVMTLLDIRGYTNAANGTGLSFIMDPDKQNARSLKQNTYRTNATGSIIGNMRYYRIYIPINKNAMVNGMHTIKAETDIGGSMLYDFPVSELPPDSYVPNASIKYIGNRNPWIPTPTPEIRTEIKVVKVVETQIVIKEVTQPVQVVFEQQKKASDDAMGFWVMVFGAVAVGIIVLVWLIRQVRKTQEEKEW